jgi:ribose transport system permease protein
MNEQLQQRAQTRTPAAAPRYDARTTARARAGRALRRYRIELVIAVAVVLIELLLSIDKPAALSNGNLTNIAQAAAPLVILAFGELLVMVTGGIDLSIGSIFSLTGVVTAAAIPGHGVAGAVLIGLAVGGGTGLFNGFCVGVLDLAPFIVTLITFSVDGSLAFVVANGNSKPVTSQAFAGINNAHLGPVPIYIVYVVVLLIGIELAFLRLTFGRWLFAVGSNERAARLLGIPTRSVKLAAYTLSGLLASFAAILSIAYLQDAEVTAGNGLELQAIAAVVIGGASLFGGVGSAFSALVGAVLVTVIQNAVDLLGINSFYNGTVTGGVILLAVLLERVTRGGGSRQQSILRWFTNRDRADAEPPVLGAPPTNGHQGSTVT